MSGDQLDDATPVIYALQDAFDMPDRVATAAVRLYDQYSDGDEEWMHKRYLERRAGACFFLAAKVHEEAPMPRDLAAHLGVEKRTLLRSARDIAGELGLDPSTITDPIQYVDLFCDELDLGEDVRRQAELVVSHTQEEDLTSGKSPRGIAAAAVYFSSVLQGQKVIQKEVANASDVSEVTIRNRYQEQAELDPPIYGEDVGPGEFADEGSVTDTGSPGVTWDGRDDPAEYVAPSGDVLNTAAERLDLGDEEDQVIARAKSLFRLAQDSGQCNFTSADQVDEWAVAAVCVAAEQLASRPDNSEKDGLAALVNLDAQKLEGRCYKLRRAWDTEADTQ